jgi:predicted transporter
MKREQMQNQTSLENKNQTSQITTTIGLGLVVMGIIILAGEIFNFGIGRYIWPFFILIPGAVLLVLSNQKSITHGEPLVIIGSILTMIGLLFLYQTITNHWVSWAYAWALVSPTSFGLGLWWFGNQQNRENLVKTGKQLAKIGAILFLAGAVFFEIILGLSKYGRIITPILLIGLGIYFLYQSIKK